MKKQPVLRFMGATGLVMASVFATLPDLQLGSLNIAGNVVYAENNPTVELAGCKSPPERRRLSSLSNAFFKSVADIDDLISPPEDKRTGEAPEPDFAAAWPRLERLMNRCDDCSPYERAQLYQRAAVIKYNMDEIPASIDYFQRVVAQAPNIPDSLERQLTYQIAQLLTSEGEYREALDYFGQWEALCPTNVPDDYFYFRAQNFYQLEDFPQALKEVNQAVAVAESKGDIPREPWYRLQMAIYVNDEDFANAETVAEKLVVQHTSFDSIKQLASLYGANGKEDKQLALLDTLNVADELDRESEYRNLGFLYLAVDVPYLASRVFEKGLDKDVLEPSSRNLEVYAVALTQAQEREKAMPVMAQAAEKSDSGKLYGTLAAIYIDAEQFDDAVKAGREALKKGDLRSEGEVHMYVGTALMYLERFDDAVEALKKATDDEQYEKYASDLIEYVGRERRRIEALREATNT